MMKVELDLQIPEGYEVAEGKPRIPKNLEYFYVIGCDSPYQCKRDDYYEEAIIIKKKEPKYLTDGFMTNNGLVHMVSINALADALLIIEDLAITAHDREVMRKLQRLLK